MKIISYDRFIRRMVVVSTVIISTIFLLYGYIIQSNSIERSLKEDAQVKVNLLFENLYSVMRGGGNKDDIYAKVNELQQRIPNSKISLHKYDTNNLQPHIQRVFQEKEMNIAQIEGYFDFASPILYEQKCKQCHTTATIGEIAAVMHVEYPIMELMISLKDFLILISVLFVISLIVIFILWFFFLRNYFVNPIRILAQAMKKTVTHDDLQHEVAVGSRIEEVQEIVNVFNEQNKKLLDSYRQLESLSYKDSLTCVFNRRKFDEIAEQMMEESKRYEQTFSLILMDLNRFKQINDTYGHDIGDRVLVHFTEIVNSIIRKTDHFFRMGGDEFSLILPYGTSDDTQSVVEKIKEQLAITPFQSDTVTLTIEASFGYVQNDAGETIDALYKIADERMYSDKNG